MTLSSESRGTSTPTRSWKMARDQSSTERNLLQKRSPNDRTPLMDHPQHISQEALRALSYILVASIILTLTGMCLIFFSDDIHDVLWESISLLILGASATVVTVLPGSGPYIVERWRNFRSSLLARWRLGYFCECCCKWDVLGSEDAPALTA